MERWIKQAAAMIGAAASVVHPSVYALFLLIVLDVLTGVAKSFINGTLSSDASRKGMTKKAVILLVVATGAVAQGISGLTLPVNLVSTLATFYCISELISIVENVAQCGVPLPDFVTKRFAQIKEKTDGTRS